MTPEELKLSRELLMSLINDVIKPCQSIEPSNADETVFKIAMNVIAIHVPKLFDYINELENMPLIQTVKHLQEENKQLLEFVTWVDEHIMWGNSDGRCIDAKAKARHILEGESHANL